MLRRSKSLPLLQRPAFVFVPLLYLSLLGCANNKHCWELRHLIVIFQYLDVLHTACVLMYIFLKVTTSSWMATSEASILPCFSWTSSTDRKRIIIIEIIKKTQPKINHLYFKIYNSLWYHFFRDLQFVNFLSSAKISKPKIH